MNLLKPLNCATQDQMWDFMTVKLYPNKAIRERSATERSKDKTGTPQSEIISPGISREPSATPAGSKISQKYLLLIT